MKYNKKIYLQYIILKFLVKLISNIPRKTLIKLSVPMGKFWYRIDRYHREIARSNMMIAFGKELDKGKIEEMVKDTFIQFSRTGLDLFLIEKINKDNLDSFVEFCGVENFKDAMGRGKGILFVSAHLGNWEIMALACSIKLNLPVHVVARPLDYLPFHILLKEIRSRTGNIVIDKNNSAPFLGNLLRENNVVAILLDQNASWYEGVYVPFFGRVACTNKGATLFALRYGATVLPIFNVAMEDGRYKIIFDKPITFKRTRDLNKDVIDNTVLLNNIIEKYVRLSPKCWFWFHRRWRIKNIPERAHELLNDYKESDN